ncbi:hypothetical protein R3W88_033275 [Solanum pinnatisectum]|uniref:F-box domain-containing protein n=1 Tax=Solanum pinnatisectum TaxID=50273 RepID=A0AAV9K1U4_9SOLN|nr:hypothetical protein R3W88_033275 [Solanum pinnatisectum]
MNSAGKIVSIPQEIMFEIFSWLPSNSLMRFKCVSKFCNSMVSDSAFLDIHKCHSVRTKFLVHGEGVYYTAEEKKDGKASASVLQLDTFNNHYNCNPAYSRLNCVNGLFCGYESSYMQATIFNPSTKQVRFLPKPNEGKCWNTFSLGFESEENKYKVLRTTYHPRERHTKYWVFTLGIDKSWRDTQNIFPCIPYSMPSVCTSGVIYQFAMADYISIVAFDVKSEKIENIALWYAVEFVYYYQLIEVKSKLGVIDYRKWVRGYFDLWILEKTPKREWERHIIGVPSIWKTTKPKFASFFDGEIVFVVNSGDSCCLCYDFTRKSWRELKIKGHPKENDIKGIYSYVESLVPFG